MPESQQRSTSEQDEYLLRLYQMMQRYAPKYARKDQVDDVVHEIVEKVLVALRNGTWDYPDVVDEAFARRLLANHVNNRHKKRRTADEHDGEHLRCRELTHPAWMSPDLADGEEWAVEVQERVLAALPRRCRMAYYMVRVEGDTYAGAAARLGVTTHSVGAYIKRVHRLMREELAALGIDAPLDDSKPTTDKPRWLATDRSLSPRYVANPAIALAE